MGDNLIEKYNLSEKDLYILSVIEKRKENSSFIEKEKLKGKSMSVLKPYKVKFMDLGILLDKISENTDYYTRKEIIDKYGEVDLKIIKSSSSSFKYGFILGMSLIIPFFLVKIMFNDSGPNGTYIVGPSSENCSYITFSPPNKVHTGNKNNGLINCSTEGSYIYNSQAKTIIVSGCYNSNCGSISDRNGTWKIEGGSLIDPDGVYFR